VPVSISVYGDIAVYKRGGIVKVMLTSIPDKNTGFLKFKLNGSNYDKKLDGQINVLTLHPGDTITLKYLAGHEDNFLFPNEDPLFWDYGIEAIMAFLACCFMYYGLRKVPPDIKVYFRKWS